MIYNSFQQRVKKDIFVSTSRYDYTIIDFFGGFINKQADFLQRFKQIEADLK